MNTLTDPVYLRSLLKRYGLWAKKRLGQHFLTDASVLSQMIESAQLSPSDHVVEFGSGHGVLTTELLPLVSQVTAVEIDADILPVLRETTRFYRDRLQIHQGHILSIDPPEGAYKIVSNLPYQLTKPVLYRFLYESPQRPQSLTLLLQLEPAQKLFPGKSHTLYSLLTEQYAIPAFVTEVSESAFSPPPRVKSAIVHLAVRETPVLPIEPQALLRFLRHGFRSPRKKLKASFPIELLESAGLSPDSRPGDLSLQEWGSLYSQSHAP